MAFDSSGRYLVARGHDGPGIECWDLSTNHKMALDLPVDTGTGFGIHSNTIAICTDDHGKIGLWNLETNRLMNAFGIEARNGSSDYVAFNADGRRVAVCYSNSFDITTYDALSGQELRIFSSTLKRTTAPSTANSHLKSVASFSGNGKWIIGIYNVVGPQSQLTGSRILASAIHVWDNTASSNMPLRTLTNDASCAAASPSGRFLATGQHNIMIYESPAFKHLHSFWCVDPKTTREKLVEPFREQARENQRLKAEKLQELLRNRKTNNRSYFAKAYPDAFYEQQQRERRDRSPDGGVFTRVDERSPAPTANDEAILRNYNVEVTSLAFSEDSKWLACGRSDGVVLVFDTSQWTTRWKLSAHQGIVSGVVFSPDSRALASCGLDGTIRISSLAGNGRR